MQQASSGVMVRVLFSFAFMAGPYGHGIMPAFSSV